MTIDLAGITSAPAAIPRDNTERAQSVAGAKASQNASGLTHQAGSTAQAAPVAPIAPAAPAGKVQMNIDPQTSQLVIQVVSGNSIEIIRKIPAEEVVQFAHTLDSPTGNLVQSKA